MQGDFSSNRYKKDVQPLGMGLETVEALRPVSFRWKESGEPDFGLIAEEVAEVEPFLAVYNRDGEIDGVKYNRLSMVLINAVKELKKQIDDLRAQNEALKSILCEDHPEAGICN